MTAAARVRSTRRSSLLLGALLAACATTSRETAVSRVEIAEQAAIALPDSSALTDHVDATQLLTATYEDRTYTMQVELEWRSGSIFVAALDSLGTVVFSLAYDGDSMEIRGNSMLARRVRPKNILADMLLTFWEVSRIEPRLQGEGLTLVEGAGRRSVLKRGQPIIVIEYENASPWEGTVRFEHVERGYVLEIETIRYVGS